MGNNITVYLEDLDLSKRIKDILQKNGVLTLDALEKVADDGFGSFQELKSEDVLEITALLSQKEIIYSHYLKRQKKIDSLSDTSTSLPVEELGLSSRAYNAIKRAHIDIVGQFVQLTTPDIIRMRHVGVLTREEIQSKINSILEDEDQFKFLDEQHDSKNNKQGIIKEKVLNIDQQVFELPIEKLLLGARATNALKNAKIFVVGDLLKLDASEVVQFRNIGVKTKNEIVSCIDNIINVDGSVTLSSINHYLETKQCFVYIEDEDKEINIGKGYDFSVIDILIRDFSFKPVRMKDWFGVSRQSIYNALEKRNQKRASVWTGKTISEQEKELLFRIIESKRMEYADETVSCICMNNLKDNFVCIFVYDVEIKCWFLKDLPEDLKNTIIDANYHRYTESELAGDSDGEIVYYIRKPYFLPNNPERFRANARLHQMSPEEYSLFFSGYPSNNSNSVRDDTIISYFRDNLIDGKVYLSSDSKNQWIRSLASRNGYSLKGFIELYGFEAANRDVDLSSEAAKERHIKSLQQYIVKDNTVFLPTSSPLYRVVHAYAFGRGMTITDYLNSLGFERTTERPGARADLLEKDMQTREARDDSIEEKVFALYPLLGSAILPTDVLHDIDENARICIDTVIKNPQLKLSLRNEMQITIAAINYAKKWRNEENSNFWDYITLQFGYRGNIKIIEIIQKALESALKKNQRLFYEDTNGRAFKSTMVMHAYTTQKSWMALLDFLFDFYKNNLNWKIVAGDPLLDTMVRELQNKLAGESESTNLTISYKVYSFQEGVKKLVLFRPRYMRNLLEKLITRIDSLVNSIPTPASTYEDQLCDDWFKEKIAAIANSRKKEQTASNIQREVAIDYSSIRPKYTLRKGSQIQIVLPDIRLLNDEFENVKFSIYINSHMVKQSKMSWYGNELGKTLNGLSIPLPDIPYESKAFQVRVTIDCDDELIFDSEDELNRSVFLFYGVNEISAGSLKQGNYMLVTQQDSVLKTENVEITEIDSFENGGMKAHFLELKPGYLVSVNDKLLAFDNENQTDLRVIIPAETTQLPQVTIGDYEYSIAYSYNSCTIILSKINLLQQFIILKNGSALRISDLSTSDNNLVFTLPLAGENELSHIQIVTLEGEKLLFDKRFLLINKGSCSFNRDFYYDGADYDNAIYRIHLDDYEESVSLGITDDEVRVPFRNGILHTQIPRISLEESSGEWFNGVDTYWYVQNVPQDSFLKIDAPKELKIQLFVDNHEVLHDERGIFAIGNALQSLYDVNNLRKASFEMRVSSRQQNRIYQLGYLFFKEGFIKRPEFWVKGSKLFWDHGEGFIGKAGRLFTLSLFREQRVQTTFSLEEQTEYIEIPIDYPTGNYRYEISVLSGNLFKKVRDIIAEGDCIIGDPNILRFKDRRIVVDSITDADHEEVGHIPIRSCYIDHIFFVGERDTSEGYCPVYSGIMYKMGQNGERFEFSSDVHVTKKGKKIGIVNPVSIVFAGESTLCITDPDGDGLYYYQYYDRYSNKIMYEITDHEYTQENRHNYSNADLYLYHTERIS